MQTTAAPASSKPRPRANEGLINVSSRVLELALKLRVRAVGLSKDVRPFVENLLSQLEDDAARLQFTPSHVDDLKYALVAFFDETVLSLDNSALRQEWASEPLQIAHFGKAWAGKVFFDRLEGLLKDPVGNADVIEIYYLCLLLGYKGKYNIGLSEDEDLLRETIKDVAAKLRSAGRLSANALSGHWSAGDQPGAPREEGLPVWAKFGGGALLALAFFTFLILYALQSSLTVTR